MSDEEIDYSTVDWTEQEEEMEAIQVIFPEELNIKSEKPYNFEIQINSNADEEDNHLKVLLLVELPHDYPQNVPHMRIKNLAPDYLDNKTIDDIE